MKRFRLELATVALFAVLIGLTALAPQAAYAENGCPDQDHQIQAGSYFNIGFQCNISGDVDMRTSSGGYQRLYDDDDASTGNIIRCTNAKGYTGYANWGGYISARDAQTMAVDTFKYVPNLRYIDTRCFPESCGVTRFYPPLYPPVQVPPTVYNPCPSGGVTPTCTVNGKAERICSGWCQLLQGEAGLGDSIQLSNGRGCFNKVCYRPYAEAGGWLLNGWVNPQTWRTTGPVQNW